MQRPRRETVTLDDILITEELSRRSPRSPKWQAEARAMQSLAQQMAGDSASLMPTLVDTALKLCQAGTAGVSELSTTPNGEKIFRWNFLAGTLAHHVGGSVPYNFSPCGVCLEQGDPVLFSHPERYFTYFQSANTPIVEVLVLPLIADRHVFGTIWIMSHDEHRHFDCEDVRIMTSLADFTATALLLQQRQTGELLAANAALETEVVERKLSEEQTQALIANLPGGAAFVVDRDLRYLLAEGEALAIAGFKREDFVGRTIFEVLPPELATNYEPMYRQALAGEPFEHEHNAHARTYISRGTPLRAENRQIYAVLVVSYDISDRKRAEAALRESEERFRAFVTVSWDMVYCMSADWLEMRNLEGKEILANTKAPSQTWIETYIPTAEQSRVWAAIEAAIRTKSPFELEHQVIQQDGTIGWVFSRAIPMLDDQGDIIEWFGAGSDITARKQTEAALRASEAKYRSLFDSMDEAYAVVEVIANDKGEWNDFLFLEVNPAFVAQTGMEYPVGRRATELLGTPNPTWAQIYGRVAETGEPSRFEEGEATLGRVFDLYVFRLGEDGSRRVAVLFTDITDRKRRDANQQLLVEMAEDLTRLSTEAEMMQALGVRLAQHLHLNSFTFVDVNQEREEITLKYAWNAADMPIMPGTYRIADYVTPDFARAMRTGEAYIISDVQTDPRTNTQATVELNIYSYVVIPYRRDGKWIGNFSFSDGVPRQWREDEIELMREVTNQTFPRLERARTEVALRESEAKYRSLFDSIDAGFCIFKMIYNEAGEAIDFCYTETNPAFERQSGRRPQPGQTMRELFPEAEDMWLKDYAEAARTGQPKRFIDFHEDLDRWFDVFVFPTSNGKNQLAALFSDVTDEKRAEEALRESEERLQKAISIETVGVLFFTLDGQITDANDTFLRISGYSRDELCTITNWQDLAPPEFWDATSGAAEELATLGKTAPYEKQHLRKDGSRWWGLFSPTRLKESGRNAECVEFVIDISNRKQAEAQLHRAVKTDAFRVKLADGLRSLSDPVQIQAEACRLLGEQLGVDRAYYVEIHEAKGYARVNQHYSRGDSPLIVGNYRLSEYGWSLPIMRRGETIVITDTQSTNIIPNAERAAMATIGMIGFVALPLIKAEVLVGALAVNEPAPREWSEAEVELVRETAERIWADIQRANAETALRQSEEKYRSLFELIDDGFAQLEVLYDDDNRPIDCRFLEVSPSFETQTGLPEAQGKTLRELIPSVESGWFEHYHQALVTNALVHFEMRQDYLNTWFEVDVFPQGNPQDRQVTIVFRNINERKQAQANQIQLIREQSAREQERQRAESLAELDRAKTLFFSNVSHEFRTPLTLSLAPLQDALSDRAHPLDPVHRERLELVHRNSLRLLKLVNTLLDFSRIEAGRMEAIYESTDLATYTAELASVFRSAIKRAGLQLIVDCPPLPGPVFVDQVMWEKIVLNLLSNAFKFTFGGEITVRLHPTDGECVMLQIGDTGTGIAPEELPHLFERFYQVRGAASRTHEGSGIGLALVQELIKMHGGTVEVSSTVGQGTCFSVTIPLGTAHLPSDRLRLDVGDRTTTGRTLASTAIGAAAYVEEAERWLPSFRAGAAEGEFFFSSSASSASPAHVLLVDDNADMRDYLTRILSEHAQVEAVADGAAALAAVQQALPDLVLSDVMMPQMDGLELVKALRSDARTREVPIVLLSARAGEESMVEGLVAGANDYLIKPFSATSLVTRVLAHLGMAQLRSDALRQEKTISRMKDKFLAEVSHELNTPLVAILGWTRLLRSNPSNQSMLSKSLETIERNAKAQAKLIEDLLDISRITAGKISLNLEPVELQQAIEAAIATISQSLETKDISLECLLDPLPTIVQGDPNRLQQIFLNLLTNAIKFTPNGGRIVVSLEANETQALIVLTDNGYGISADELPYIFDTFRQGAISDKGLGLGLAIARHLVELHNGTIYAESSGVGLGATFIVGLPLQQL